ncbi:hypothetical protein SAMN05446635_5981 [Burkholderia sp. OK233]|nr:hypothetical protein SAMN05446635_5981 [Burkholderia sp. OK233]
MSDPVWCAPASKAMHVGAAEPRTTRSNRLCRRPDDFFVRAVQFFRRNFTRGACVRTSFLAITNSKGLRIRVAGPMDLHGEANFNGGAVTFAGPKRIPPSRTRQSSLTIASPRPTPGISSPAARSDSSNMRSQSGGAMPTPVSATRRYQPPSLWPPIASSSLLAFVYLAAFDGRFSAICFTLMRFDSTVMASASKLIDR